MQTIIGSSPATQWSEFWRAQANTADDDPVMRLASGQGFVLDARDLDDLGISRAAMRTRLRRGTWVRSAHGFVTPVVPPTAHHAHATTAASAVRRRRHDAVTGRSSAVLHGLPVMGLPARPQVTLRREWLGTSTGSPVHCRTGWLEDDEIMGWFGVPVSTVPRTLVDLARHDRFDAIMASDAALRTDLCGWGSLDAALARAAGWPGIRQARSILELADPRSESPLESVTRLRLHDDGFPPPELQFWIAGFRVDFCWPAPRLVLEVDGRVKYRSTGADQDPLWAEKQREQAIRRAGYRVERVIASDVYRNWSQTSAHLRSHFPLLRRVG